MLALIFQTLNAANANNDTKSNKVVDQDFLNTINSLKEQMIKEGSIYKNVEWKFITKTNRFGVADHNLKV